MTEADGVTSAAGLAVVGYAAQCAARVRRARAASLRQGPLRAAAWRLPARAPAITTITVVSKDGADGGGKMLPASDEYPGLVQAIGRALARKEKVKDSIERAMSQAHLMAALQEQLERVAAARDVAISEALAQEPPVSHNRLAPMLGISRQRLDTLARLARTRTDGRSR